MTWSWARMWDHLRSSKGLRAIRQKERLESERLESERLKSNYKQLSAAIKWRQKDGANSKARRMEIRRTVMKAEELDLCFLLDRSSSMGTVIDMVKDKVTVIAGAINVAYPQCKLRISLVVYDDYDRDTDPGEGCNFTTDFRGLKSEFMKALSAFRVKGGYCSHTADVFTGLERVADLKWRAQNRLLLHICNAPCHGTQFPERQVIDYYPNGDKFGRNIAKILRQLHDHCQVTRYYFCHLNHTTKKMVQVFKEAVREDGWIEETLFRDIQKIREKVVSMPRSTIDTSVNNISAGLSNHGGRFVPDSVVQLMPLSSWERMDIPNGEQHKHKWYHSLDELLMRISNKEPLEVEKMEPLRVKIEMHPFSAEGTLRWPYHAQILQPDQSATAMVVKRFKMPLNKSLNSVHSKEQYLSQMEVQTVAAHMAQEFNERSQSKGLRGIKKVQFTLVSTLYVGFKIYNMEEYLAGDYIRYSNNAGYVNTVDYAATLQAFTHWTHQRSTGTLMVTDLQGVKQATNKGREYMFLLSDPAIHCIDVLRFGRTNLGEEGFKLFFQTHNCNDICRHLGLRAPNGYSPVGTQSSRQKTVCSQS